MPVSPIDLTIRVAIGARVARLENQINRDRKILKAGLLHNIGMVCVPASLLRKKRTEMTARERVLYLSHPIQGESILNENEKLRPVAARVRMHHEQYNGKGFPDTLAGNQIPLPAKMIAAVSLYDNLVHRGKCPLEDIPSQLQRYMGYQLDPNLYEYLVQLNLDNMVADARKKYQEIRFEDLTEGMVLARNIRLKGGAMAMPFQTKITTFSAKRVRVRPEAGWFSFSAI